MPRLSSTQKAKRAHDRDRVAELMAAGQSTRQIAYHVGITEKQVWKLWAEAQELARSSSRLNIITAKAQRRSHLEFLLSATMRYVTNNLDPQKFASSGMTHREFQGYLAEAARLNAALVRLDGLESPLAPPVNPHAGPNEGNLVGDEAENDPKRAKELLDFIYKDGEKHPDLVAAFQKYYPAYEGDAAELDAAAKEFYGTDEELQPEDNREAGGGDATAAGAEATAGPSAVPDAGKPHEAGHDPTASENQ